MSKLLFSSARLAMLQIVTKTAVVYFLCFAALYALSTFFAIVNFGWRQPMFDQWGMYVSFLDLPFPQNAIQSMNGHRPIFPNLLRIAEIHWLSANQLLQVTFGAVCAFMVSAFLCVLAWQERTLSLVERSAGAMIGVLAILWMANVRNLIHGNESVHAYLLMLAVVSALTCVFQATFSRPVLWLVLASLACTVATFCIGPGFSSFAAVIALGFALKLPRRLLLIPLSTAILCLVLYTHVLPGKEGVRAMLDFAPLESLRAMIQWLSAPWINGWLGAAEPHASWVLIQPHGWIGRCLIVSANFLLQVSHLSWRALATVPTVASLIYLLYLWVLTLRGRWQPQRLAAVALGIALFGVATAATISIARLDYLRQFPDQVYADRYLDWPSLYWAAIALLFLCRLRRRTNRVLFFAGFAFFILLPIALLPTHRSGIGWSAEVFRVAQQGAAAACSDVQTESMIFSDADSGLDNKLHVLEEFRRRHLAMFAQCPAQNLGMHWDGTLASSEIVTATATWKETFADVPTEHTARHLEGIISQGIAAAQKSGQLTLLAEDGEIVGFAEYSFLNKDTKAFKFSIPRKRGFDGYIHDYDPDQAYTLALLDFATQHGIVLATLPAQPTESKTGTNLAAIDAF